MRNFLRFCFVLVAVFLMHIVQAQERTISGKVTSAEDGAPIPGVNVIFKGTTVGTVTDFEGNYKLTVPAEDGTLVFRFIGLRTREIAIGNQSVIDVALAADVTQLSEVVVTAIGIEREARALGYSVEEVGGDKVQQVSEPDALRALQGKVPGVNIQGTSGAPGSSTRITIRGNSSLLGNNQPLFVVDGIPFNNNSNRIFLGLSDGSAYGSRIADLDPNNIESITVLKGAAAAALYGNRAANGVVLITTKSGNAKASKQGLEITYQGSFGIENIANLPDYQNTYGTGTNFNYQQVNGSWGAPFIGTRPYANTDSITHWFDGRPGMEEFWGTNVPYRAYPDNVKDLFETGKLFENSIQINGGNENSALSATVSHTLHDGYVPNTRFERTNVSVGGNTELANGFIVGGSVAYIRSEQRAVQSGIGGSGANNQSAFARSLYLGRNWDVHGQPYQNPVDFGPEFMVARGQADNPLWSYENVGFRSRVNRAIAQLSVGYDITDWLNVSYKIGANVYNDRQKDFIRPGSTGPRESPGVGRVTTYDVDWEEIESNFLVTFNQEIIQNLSLRAIVGHNYNQRTFDAQSVQGTNYVVFDIDDLDNTNNVVPFGGDYERKRLWGLFADVSLGWRDWAFLGLTARNDWSSTLPKENRSYFYPAITGSVILSDALNIQSATLSSLKIRGAYAEVGNDTDPYLLAPVYLINDVYDVTPRVTAELPFTPTGGATSPGATLDNQERDPNLKPERTSEIEGGLDLYLFDNRIGINATYYNRETRDQIAPVTLPVTTGFTSLLTNFGIVRNEGIELALDLTPVRLPNGFTWNIYGTFTHNKNKVIELEEGVEEITLTGGRFFAGEVSAVLRPGQEYGLLKGTINVRDQDGNLLIDPSNGQMIRALETEIIGNPNPDFIVGVTNTFSWKGLRLTAVFDWKQGGDFWSNTILSMLGRGVTKANEDREINKIIPGVYGDPNTFEPIRDEAGNKIPNQTMIEENSLWFGETFAINAANEWSVFDGTYFRLREVTLGYELPNNLLENTPFGRASIALTGRNLWYKAPNVPEHTNFDPEVNQFSNSNVQGIEWSATPTTRRFSVNLSLTF
jgi:TonB-linked SusC/RagA family outer membrane protein